MKKLLSLCLILIICELAAAQVKVTHLNKITIPKRIKYIGHIINAVTYTDNGGKHLVITTETAETPSKNADGDDYRDKALYAYHYLLQSGNYKLAWTVQDFVKDCPVDLAANFVKNTFAVTDLDKNSVNEIWLMYKTVCHGDVSPSVMKIIMHEGDKKYAVRGTTKVKVSSTQYEGGEYAFDNAFKAGPQVFRTYAKGLWTKNIADF